MLQSVPVAEGHTVMEVEGVSDAETLLDGLGYAVMDNVVVKVSLTLPVEDMLAEGETDIKDE